MFDIDPDAVAAYFSMAKAKGVARITLQSAFADWQKLDARRKALARRLGTLEERASA